MNKLKRAVSGRKLISVPIDLVGEVIEEAFEILQLRFTEEEVKTVSATKVLENKDLINNLSKYEFKFLVFDEFESLNDGKKIEFSHIVKGLWESLPDKYVLVISDKSLVQYNLDLALRNIHIF